MKSTNYVILVNRCVVWFPGSDVAANTSQDVEHEVEEEQADANPALHLQRVRHVQPGADTGVQGHSQTSDVTGWGGFGFKRAHVI